MSTASETEPMGTFACPICGVDTPHYHPPEQVAAYRDDQARGDGWTSTAHRQPKQSGWYLCLGVEVDPDQYGEPKDIWDNSYDANRWRQLSWFRWVRDAAAHHVQEAKIQEVLYFERSYGQQRWQLRNFLGNAVPSGAESRFPVHAQPKYWRDLLDAPTLPGGKSDQGEKEKPADIDDVIGRSFAAATKVEPWPLSRSGDFTHKERKMSDQMDYRQLESDLSRLVAVLKPISLEHIALLRSALKLAHAKGVTLGINLVTGKVNYLEDEKSG